MRLRELPLYPYIRAPCTRSIHRELHCLQQADNMLVHGDDVQDLAGPQSRPTSCACNTLVHASRGDLGQGWVACMAVQLGREIIRRGQRDGISSHHGPRHQLRVPARIPGCRSLRCSRRGTIRSGAGNKLAGKATMYKGTAEGGMIGAC